MRNIRFRAWDRGNKKMIENYAHVGQNGHFYTIDYSDPIIEYEVMSFTGLHDRNGKEIYEGDIVRLNNEEMNKSNLNWVSDPNIEVNLEINTYSPAWNYFEKYGEVIGNIYENPELLKGEKV